MKREVGTPRNGAYLVEAVADPLRLNGDQTHKERHGRMRPRLRGGLKTLDRKGEEGLAPESRVAIRRSDFREFQSFSRLILRELGKIHCNESHSINKTFHN
ncbi:hypothetical protein SLE2022_403560 [Rubroshorea leprosula]